MPAANLSGRAETERRVALVTGAGSGIGRATAIRLAAAGYDIGLTFRANAEAAAEVVSDIRASGREALAVALDLANPRSVQRTIDELIGQLGDVDVLVNNAGVNRRALALDETVDGWEATLAVDLVGPWACSRAAARHMIEAGHGGRIINVTSVLGHAPISGGSAYCAAKAGLEMLTKVLALEFSPHGITVNAVAPGHTATPMNYDRSELSSAPIARPVITAGRAADADEIAAAIAYLASSPASYTNGASLLVDGGLLLVSGPESLQREIGLPREKPGATT